jgi:hypothetical protein
LGLTLVMSIMLFKLFNVGLSCLNFNIVYKFCKIQSLFPYGSELGLHS